MQSVSSPLVMQSSEYTVTFPSYLTAHWEEEKMWLRGGAVWSTGSKKHVRAKPGGAALIDILSYSSIRPPFLQSRWTRETSRLINLLILAYVLENDNSHPGRAQTILINSAWYHLQPMLWLFYLEIFLCHEDSTYGKMLATCLRCGCTCPTRIIKIRHHPKHTLVVSNQINCSCLKELSLSGAQFDTWVIEAPAQVIIL